MFRCPVLKVSHLHKRYGTVVALDDVDVDVQAGQIIGLLGPNGAGKTTLVSIVAGLRRPDAGSVHVDGVDVTGGSISRVRRMLGVASQDLAIYPVVTVRENLEIFGRLYGLPRRQLPRRIEWVGERLRLTHLLDRRAGALSGGEKRRLHIAVALVHDPQLLLFDEATAGTDVDLRAELLEVVATLARAGAAVVYSTHYLQEVEHLGGSVVILDHGRVIANGSVDELIVGQPAFVELAFEGPAPALDIDGALRTGSVVRLPTHDPAAVMKHVVASLGSGADRLRGIEIVRPSLEAVYLSLVGRRYDEGGG